MKVIHTLLLLTVLFVGQQAWAGKAINFVLTDTKGKVHRLSDYAGKWVLINFWAPWCPRCWMEFPILNDLDSQKNFVVIGVAMDYGGNISSVLTYSNRYNLRYPQILGGNRRDPNSPAHQIGPVDFYPTSYLYAPDGELVMFIPGIISRNKLASFMDQYAKENPTMFATMQKGRVMFSKGEAATSADSKIASIAKP